MRQKNNISLVEPIPIKYFGTPITDETFEKQDWERIEGQDSPFDDDFDDDFSEFDIEFSPDPDIFDEDDPFGDFDGEFEDFPFEPEPKYPNEGEWEDEYYFWVLKLPRDYPTDNCLTLISTTSDHHLPGFKKGEYIVELYGENGLGICQSEEQIEILYKAITGESIYD